MEKILINSQSLNLIPMGITESDKKRTFTVLSDLTYANIETIFSDVSCIKYLSESDEILVSYLDGIKVKTISKDFEKGTYTIEISTDAIEKKIAEMQAQIDVLTATQTIAEIVTETTIE